MPRRLPQNRLRQAIDYIHDNLEEDLSVATLAAVAHLSSSQFAHLFKASTGLSPHQYVIAQRVERARRFIRDESRSLAQVAATVGLASQSQLTRHFKRLVGVTPAAFRQQHRSAR